jgi:BlaI family penicillinase repressor
MKRKQFGRVQMRIMNTLWEKGKITAREISTMLNEVETIDHRNVQILLRGLEEKGVIGHETVKNTHYYFPLIRKEQVLKQAVGNMVEQFFQGSVHSLMSFIVKKRYVSEEELETIIDLLQKDKNEDK